MQTHQQHQMEYEYIWINHAKMHTEVVQNSPIDSVNSQIWVFLLYESLRSHIILLYPPNNEVVGVYIGFTPSVRPSRLPCPLCNIYSSGWILFILATNDHYHERVCRTQWPLTLTYIFKVIRPWLRKSCPLCSFYSSGWILFILGTNDYYY